MVKDIGYDQDGFSFYGADVEVLLHGQSPDIAMGVDAKKKNGVEEEGAGDQGMMFGYACTESEVYEKGSFMPAPIYFAHKVLKILRDKRHDGQAVRPAARCQEPGDGAIRQRQAGRLHEGRSLDPAQRGKPQRQEIHAEHGARMIADTVASALPKGWMPKKASDFLVNPTGNFVVGGPDGDCGLTGRKIIVDTYGGYAPHGGGAFSGKDPTKVDRSAAYAARYLAKNVVAAGLAEQCTIQVAYAIGVAEPMSVRVDLHGGGKDGPGQARESAAADFLFAPDQHPARAETQSADLSAHRRLRPFRTQARQGRRLFVGTARPGRRTQAGNALSGTSKCLHVMAGLVSAISFDVARPCVPK